MTQSSIRRLLLTALMALTGAGLTIGFISLQVQVGNITVIIGDHNKVENGDQSQTVIQPVKPVAAQASGIERPVSGLAVPEEPRTQTVPSPRRSVVYYADEEEEYVDEDCVCVCPDDEEEPDEEEVPEEEGPGLQSVLLS